MKKLLLSTIATVSLSSIAFSLTSTSASAAALVGEFQIGTGNALATISKNSVDFTAPNQVTINPLSGTFLSEGFDRATIQDISPIPFAGSVPNFLDLGKSTVAGSTSDSQNTFNLTNTTGLLVSETINPFTNTTVVDIKIGVVGAFTSSTSEVSVGNGILTFQYAGKLPSTNILATKATVENWLNANKTLSGVTFSGAVFGEEIPDGQPTPEPSAMLGLLGLTGFGLVSFRQKRAIKK
jgi:hypothetical protein